jgi:hypothetical protein
MSQLLRLFVQLVLLRRGPQDLPASELLLVLTLLAYVAVNALLAGLLSTDESWWGPLLVSTLFTLLWYLALLRLVRRPERTLQTVSAVFGFQTLLSPLVIGTEWLLRRLDNDSVWYVSVSCLGLLLLAWVIAANSHIVKAALEWTSAASVALVILQMLAGFVVLFAVFPPTAVKH